MLDRFNDQFYDLLFLELNDTFVYKEFLKFAEPTKAYSSDGDYPQPIRTFFDEVWSFVNHDLEPAFFKLRDFIVNQYR